MLTCCSHQLGDDAEPREVREKEFHVFAGACAGTVLVKSPKEYLSYGWKEACISAGLLNKFRRVVLNSKVRFAVPVCDSAFDQDKGDLEFHIGGRNVALDPVFRSLFDHVSILTFQPRQHPDVPNM